MCCMRLVRIAPERLPRLHRASSTRGGRPRRASSARRQTSRAPHCVRLLFRSCSAAERSAVRVRAAHTRATEGLAAARRCRLAPCRTRRRCRRRARRTPSAASSSSSAPPSSWSPSCCRRFRSECLDASLPSPAPPPIARASLLAPWRMGIAWSTRCVRSWRLLQAGWRLRQRCRERCSPPTRFSTRCTACSSSRRAQRGWPCCRWPSPRCCKR